MTFVSLRGVAIAILWYVIMLRPLQAWVAVAARTNGASDLVISIEYE